MFTARLDRQLIYHTIYRQSEQKYVRREVQSSSIVLSFFVQDEGYIYFLAEVTQNTVHYTKENWESANSGCSQNDSSLHHKDKNTIFEGKSISKLLNNQVGMYTLLYFFLHFFPYYLEQCAVQSSFRPLAFCHDPLGEESS